MLRRRRGKVNKSSKKGEGAKKASQERACYLLLKDKSKEYPHGILLEPFEGGEGKYCKYNEFCEQTISCTSSEVVQLSPTECRLLDAIYSPADRCTEYFCPGKLPWGVSLKVGDTVLAQLPDPDIRGRRESIGRLGEKYEMQYATAVIRWSGVVQDVYGDIHRFGVEIMVRLVKS